MLRAENLSVRYGVRRILDHISFSVEEGQWLMVAGPNGAGKSTLLRALSRGSVYSGRVWCGGKDLAGYHPVQLARQMGVLMQRHSVNYAFTVEEVVRLGRYAHSPGFFSGPSPDDETMVGEALAMTGLERMRERSVLTLSGGELQRTFLAQLFAQDPKLLLLDEPSNHLDLGYQKQVFGLIGKWLAEPGRAVVSVVHDLSLARAYGTHALLLHEGEQAALGAVPDVLSPENLRDVYNVDVYGWMRFLLGQWGED